MSDLEGVILSDYLLLECISKGGVADVYHARHVEEDSEGQSRDDGYEVAVKVFRSGYAQRESFRECFMTEAEKIGLFEHPNILPFLEYGEGEGLLYMVTPFVKTGTLTDLLRRVGGRFSALQALPILQQLCSAVQYAHEHEVVHGNIKPSNVFIANDGRILLADFGIARSYDDSQQSLTRVGWGSAEYIAPEQSLGIVKRGSDIYSLGALLFRVLTGSPPFVGQTPVEVLLKHVRQQPPSARLLVPSISDAVDAVLRSALQKRADDRFASVEELSNAYLAAVTMSPVASPVARTAPPRLALGTNAPVENPQTPVPVHVTSSYGANPQTPVPSYTAFGASHAAFPLPKQVEEAVPQEDFPQISSVWEEEFDSDTTEIRDKSFLQELEDEKQRNALFWSSQPPEWSPIAQVSTVQQDSASSASEGSEGSGVRGGVPPTADEYLQSRRLITKKLDADPLVDNEEPVAVPMEEVTQLPVRKHLPFGERLKKWLPVLVVILLLLGLLGAVLSAFFFPTERPGANSGHPANTGQIAGTMASSHTLATTATPVQKAPISTAGADGQNDLAAYGAIDVKNVVQSVLRTHFPGPQG